MTRRVDILIVAVTVTIISAAWYVLIGRIDSSLLLALIDKLMVIDWDAGIRRVFTVLFLWEVWSFKRRMYARMERMHAWPWADHLMALVMKAIVIYLLLHMALLI